MSEETYAKTMDILEELRLKIEEIVERLDDQEADKRAAQHVPANPVTCRERFERETIRYGMSIQRSEVTDYEDIETGTAWDLWQTSQRQANEKVLAVIEPNSGNKIRADFDCWCVSEGLSILKYSGDGSYMDIDTQSAWVDWLLLDKEMSDGNN